MQKTNTPRQPDQARRSKVETVTGKNGASIKLRRIALPRNAQPHWCFPLVDPTWVAAGEATHMRPDDPVLGVESGGGHWALPWWIMKNHHQANLMLHGKPFLVSLCEVCSTAGAFDPTVDGRRLTFKMGGMCNGTNLLTDYETGSLWAVTGESIGGALKGRELERLPLLQCTWSEWIQMHPDSLVPDGANESRDGHGEGKSPGSPFFGKEMGNMLPHADLRLSYYELVLGVRVEGANRCYPLATLEDRSPVINDRLGSTEIVVFSRPGTWMASAYNRQLGDRLLTFRWSAGAITDDQTGSRWEISGLAAAGPLAGQQLRYVYSGVEEYSVWASYFPQTEIYGLDGQASTLARSRTDITIRDVCPRPVFMALDKKWFAPGMRALDVGSGDGLVAAFMAEAGLSVHAIDASPENIARGKRSFRGVVRLVQEVADIRRPLTFEQPFDAIVDHGTLEQLGAEDRPQYLANLKAATRPGSRFLLLMRLPHANIPQRSEQLQQRLSGIFRLLGTQACKLPDASRTKLLDGVAFRFVRV